MNAITLFLALVTVFACCRYLWQHRYANFIPPTALALLAIAVATRAAFLLTH